MSHASYLRTLGGLVAGALSWRHYQSLPALPPLVDQADHAAPPTAWPPVRIVVPARDEADRLPALLASLRRLDYPTYEVVVVDDNSTDGTAGVAAQGGARVLRGRSLPSGWTGKAFACHQGATASAPEEPPAWLLFTDADTVHEPASLRAAVAYAHDQGLGALSLFTGQRCITAAERLLLPPAYAILFAGVSPRRVNRARRRSPLANGQYMLYRRDAYERAGGHSAVRGSVIEDAALARALDGHAIPYRLCRAESLVQVRMYTGLGELWAGFGKNVARYAADDPRRLPATALYSAALGSTLPLLVRALAAQRLDDLALAAAGYVAAAATLAPWYRRFGIPAGYALLHPIAAAIVGLITLDSAWRAASGRGAAWKGRTYR